VTLNALDNCTRIYKYSKLPPSKKKKENAPLNGCETKHECDVASRPAAAEDVDDALQAFQMASKVKLDSKR
jgi:hypothetical protein